MEDSAGPCSLVVHVLSASGLAKMDLNGKADPYVVLKCGKAKEQRSKVVPKNLSPVWDDAHFRWSEVEESDELVVTMLDRDKGSKDDPMGEVRVPVSEMDGQRRSYALRPTKGCKAPKGDIVMTCTCSNGSDPEALWKMQDLVLGGVVQVLEPSMSAMPLAEPEPEPEPEAKVNAELLRESTEAHDTAEETGSDSGIMTPGTRRAAEQEEADLLELESLDLLTPVGTPESRQLLDARSLASDPQAEEAGTDSAGLRLLPAVDLVQERGNRQVDRSLAYDETQEPRVASELGEFCAVASSFI